MRAANHEGLAPAFIGTAECDPSRDDAEAYAAKLKAAGVEVEVKRYPGMVHGFVSWVAFLEGARQAIDDANRFLRHQLAAATA
jgi:acetyl esterase